MKKLKRLPPPDCFDNDIETSKNEKISYYQNTGKGTTINPRWNNVCKDADGISKIRKKLLEMSNNTCAFCGIKVDNSTFDVEHFLPKDKFPYLAYSFENYLPSCKSCNQTRKKTFVPLSLKGKNLIENILSDIFPNEEVYNHQNLLSSTTDRILESTFDNPEDHLAFEPEFFMYETKTDIGKITNNIFFKHKEVAEKWERISNHIKNIVIISENPRLLVESLIELDGFEYICLQFLDYWIQEKESGRLR